MFITINLKTVDPWDLALALIWRACDEKISVSFDKDCINKPLSKEFIKANGKDLYSYARANLTTPMMVALKKTIIEDWTYNYSALMNNFIELPRLARTANETYGNPLVVYWREYAIGIFEDRGLQSDDIIAAYTGNAIDLMIIEIDKKWYTYGQSGRGKALAITEVALNIPDALRIIREKICSTE